MTVQAQAQVLVPHMGSQRKPRWFFGGLSSACAVCITHPLDLIKVHLQTQQEVKKRGFHFAAKIIKHNGITALYNGLSASIGRQLTYSLTRFAIYDSVKNHLTDDNPNLQLPFYQKAVLAMFAGACGGFIGTPPDMINVRMQNDVKLPVEKRRNYKHVFDGLWRVYTEEGIRKMYFGASMVVVRAMLMTFGQLSLYDQYKQMLLQTKYFEDNTVTHFTASLCAATCATAITQPFDVMKTRMMNSPTGLYKNVLQCGIHIAKLGPIAFYKGFVPAWIRLGPHTILTFIFFEQFKKHFGIVPKV
ncbi:mitochondrial dicarboxylate carrier-like [Anneissia japonica]|uniref:mitochondrial dicarboxylate carrier-like n=1 Tax=Anneissia japonica TaxID=1529436 RepID=UPI00142577BD|nr:mitochondrial dicarboxylate carrier-like [Anneissia japonica]